MRIAYSYSDFFLLQKYLVVSCGFISRFGICSFMLEFRNVKGQRVEY